MDAVLVGLAVMVGLALGSFATVPIERWPHGGTVARPRRSQCPACGAPVRASDNIPVVSWLRLRGRCRDCGAPISPRYLVVELITATLFGATVWVWGLHPLLPALLVLVWSLVVATVIDLEHRIIPNRLTLRLPVVLAVLLVAATALAGEWADLVRAAIAAVGVPGLMLLLSETFRLIRGQAGIGMGDIKLAISLGLVVGYLGGIHLVVFAYASIISAVVIAVALLLAGRARLASRIPFGPYLAIGTLVPVLSPDASAELMLGLFGL